MSILVENVKDGEEIPSHLVFIQGRVVQIGDGRRVSTISSRNLTDTDGATLAWSIGQQDGEFKLLVQLNPGSNIIRLWTKRREVTINITLKLPSMDNFVRLLYVVPKDHDGSYQAPAGVTPTANSAMDRIILCGKILQVFTAENFHQHGLKRKTFLLETDTNFNPVCHTFKTRIGISEARSIAGDHLWDWLKSELASSEYSEEENCKFVCFLSFTLYDNPGKVCPKDHEEVLALTEGHTAMGGGGLAVFGTGCLYAWAEDLQTFAERLSDVAVVDRTRLMDDSGNRGTYGCCYATGLGAVIHELGHTWDLPHTKTGIMGRGFDDVNRFFLLKEQVDFDTDTENNEVAFEGNCYGNCFWDRPSAIWLYNHRWFNLSRGKDTEDVLRLNGTTITSKFGLRVVILVDQSAVVVHHREFPVGSEPGSHPLDSKEICEFKGKEEGKMEVMAMDVHGNMLKCKLNC